MHTPSKGQGQPLRYLNEKDRLGSEIWAGIMVTGLSSILTLLTINYSTCFVCLSELWLSTAMLLRIKCQIRK